MSYQPTTPEACYQIWLRYWLSIKGSPCRNIVNFDKIKAKPEWVHFVKSAALCNRNGGRLDFSVWVAALFNNSNNEYFDLALLHSLRGIKIYKNYVKSINDSVSPENMRICLLKSFKHAVVYCKDNSITGLYEYISHNYTIMPTILSHYNSGNVTIHMLACVPNFPNILDGFPRDVVEEFGSEIKDNYDTVRLRLLHSQDPIITKMIGNFEAIFKSGIANSDKLL